MNKDKEIAKINRCIADLVYEKTQLKKAYNYYHLKRDAEQFRHIEENYGIGTPTSVGFTPLIKKHIDVLVGEYLELDPELQISCKDDNTVTNIMRDKQLKIHKAAFDYFKKYLQNAILQVFIDGKEPSVDPYFDKEIERIKKDVEKGYVSEYEKAAQNILNYIRYSRNIDLKNKTRELLTDLLVGGMAYYRTRPSIDGKNIRLEVLNPIDTFIERNPNEYYLNKSPRAVIRKYMTKEQIFAEYNDELTPEAKTLLADKENYGRYNDDHIWVETAPDTTGQIPSAPGLLGGLEVMPLRNSGYYSTNDNLISVYEVEWIEYDEKNDVLVRHEGVKIGDEIYIPRGESEYITRSVSNPKDCSLSVNGLFFSDKNGEPFSMILSTMDLQD